jgi:GTP:adenosylcobinamide-phosphate guanylyltransferase
LGGEGLPVRYCGAVNNIDVIVPAGGRVSEDFAAEAGHTVKALFRIGEQTLLGHTIETLRRTDGIGRVAVIGPSATEEAAEAADVLLPELATGPENIYSGLEWLVKSGSPPDHVMIITSDLPFISPEILRRYIDMCPKHLDFCLPLISKDEFEAAYPGTNSTFVQLREGTFTAGCCYLASVRGLQRAKPHIERVFEQRKSKLGMARLLGPSFVFKFMTRRLGIPDVVQRVKSLLDCDGAPIPHSPPELACDIDDVEDYRYALDWVRKNR